MDGIGEEQDLLSLMHAHFFLKGEVRLPVRDQLGQVRPRGLLPPPVKANHHRTEIIGVELCEEIPHHFPISTFTPMNPPF